MENKKLTAVEWIKEKLLFKHKNKMRLRAISGEEVNKIIHQAIEIEKQQIIEANETYSQNGNDYYSKTYKISKNGE